jgi:predicted O-methyltransferase YrrM
MPGWRGLVSNALALSVSPSAWALARRSIVVHGAVQHVDELTSFAKIVRALRPRTVVEIGTAQGGVFWLLCRLAAPDAQLISIDLPPEQRFSGGQKKSIALQRMRQSRQTVHALHGDSHSPETLRRLRSTVNDREIDLLFIDGDHTYDGVRSDYAMYSPLVRRGGLIALHDIVKTPWPKCEVDRFWGELMADQSLASRAIVGRFPSHFGGIGLVRAP